MSSNNGANHKRQQYQSQQHQQHLTNSANPNTDQSAPTSPPLLSQHQQQSQYQQPYHYNPHATYHQFQASQPFPTFQQPHQLHQPSQQLHSHHQLHSPYGQPPPHHQHLSMQQPPPLGSHPIQSQVQPTSPPSRKRKAPGDQLASPALNMASMPSNMQPPLGAGDLSQAGGSAVKAEGGLGDDSLTQPPPKKSRTNTPWTAVEENRLRGLKTQNKSWGEIAKSFPNRTEGSVKKHWYKDMHHAEFAEDESQALLNAIKEYEANKWKVIGQKVGKPAKACEQYYKEHFQGKI